MELEYRLAARRVVSALADHPHELIENLHQTKRAAKKSPIEELAFRHWKTIADKLKNEIVDYLKNGNVSPEGIVSLLAKDGNEDDIQDIMEREYSLAKTVLYGSQDGSGEEEDTGRPSEKVGRDSDHLPASPNRSVGLPIIPRITDITNIRDYSDVLSGRNQDMLPMNVFGEEKMELETDVLEELEREEEKEEVEEGMEEERTQRTDSSMERLAKQVMSELVLDDGFMEKFRAKSNEVTGIVEEKVAEARRHKGDRPDTSFPPLSDPSMEEIRPSWMTPKGRRPSPQMVEVGVCVHSSDLDEDSTAKDISSLQTSEATSSDLSKGEVKMQLIPRNIMVHTVEVDGRVRVSSSMVLLESPPPASSPTPSPQATPIPTPRRTTPFRGESTPVPSPRLSLRRTIRPSSSTESPVIVPSAGGRPRLREVEISDSTDMSYGALEHLSMRREQEEDVDTFNALSSIESG